MEDERNERKNLFIGVRKRLAVLKCLRLPTDVVTGYAVVCARLSDWNSNFKSIWEGFI
jgi:hypothetical protein